MRVAILSFGTRGDVQPFVAIGHALADRGHDVLVAAPENHVSFVQRAGLNACPITGDSERLLQTEHGKQWLMRGDTRSMMNTVVVELRREARALECDAEAATEGADLIVSGILAAGLARVFSEVRRVPWVLGHTFPQLPSRAFAPALLNLPLRLPGFVRKAAAHVLARTIWHLLHGIDDELRARRGLPRAAAEPGLGQHTAGRPSLHLWSPTLVPHPADWPSTEHITGFCTLPTRAKDGVGERAPLASLEPFLAAGPPPVFMGLGSMPMLRPEETLAMMVRVAAALGLRVLFGGTFADPAAIAALLPPTMKLCPPVDHEALFPRCAAVLHHGGAGTLAAGLRAGRPTMVCTVLGDQPFWGRLIVSRGLGAATPFRTLTEERLEAGLRRLQEPTVIENARALGEVLRREPNGAEVAAGLLEQIAAAGLAPG
jgi:sterol 3beta-glucosyltransferase